MNSYDNKDRNKIINKGIIYIIEHKTLPELKYVGQTITSINKRWNIHKTTLIQMYILIIKTNK